MDASDRTKDVPRKSKTVGKKRAAMLRRLELKNPKKKVRFVSDITDVILPREDVDSTAEGNYGISVVLPCGKKLSVAAIEYRIESSSYFLSI